MSTAMRRAHAELATGTRIPATVLRGALALVIGALCAVAVPPGFWLVVCGGIGLAAVIVPRSYAAWFFIFAIGLTALARTPDPLDGRAYAVLAGIHLVHLLAGFTVLLPLRGSIGARTLTRPALDYLLLQAPCQVLLAVALVLASGTSREWPPITVLAPVGAAAAVALAVLLVLPLSRAAGADRR
ncbi:hypothetical protein SAMN04489806_2952 [Paramicrobacterium humi]|uniref:Uncharacterized protein n=1 Tax=Paramicrobacterium humi TaxID=640635 RepID=A0A1H4QYH0_9MICO|nr:hypothetical protein [Microbacterium humi]SEC24663.1 hypothetical protein SAMN04489806_2952 [Microbacterium humi]